MASNEGKIAAAITGLTAVVFAAFILKPALDEWRMSRALAEFERKTASMLEDASREAEGARQQSAQAQNRRAQAVAEREAAKRLGPNERCVSGSVVRVRQIDGVPSYHQLIKRGQPVKCVGNRRR